MTTMGRNRLEAFSDGVLAIVITIMVLELKVPHGTGFTALMPLLPSFLSYVLSFAYVAIYWNNHHHMLHTVHHVNGQILWANLHLLFWLSLIPFTTGWMGENNFAPLPTALYGCVLLMAAFSYLLVQMAIMASHGQDSVLAKAIGRDLKGKISAVLYITGIVLSFLWPLLAGLVYAFVATLWVVPDRRIENVLRQQ